MIRFDRLQGHFLKSDKFLGCFLVLRKPLLVSFCVVVWVLFSVFCFTSFGDHTIRNTKKLPELNRTEVTYPLCTVILLSTQTTIIVCCSNVHTCIVKVSYCTVEPRSTDTPLIRTPRYYGQFGIPRPKDHTFL